MMSMSEALAFNGIHCITSHHYLVPKSPGGDERTVLEYLTDSHG
jgi:hypothetical protein